MHDFFECVSLPDGSFKVNVTIWKAVAQASSFVHRSEVRASEDACSTKKNLLSDSHKDLWQREGQMLSEDLIRCLRASYAAPDEEVSDTELLRRCAAKKDDVAFELLVRRHAELVWQVCTATAGNHHAAEDAFQATFLALAMRATSIRETVSGWLYRVAYNASRKVYIREKAAVWPIDPVPGRPISDSPEDTASKVELAGILHDELSRLNEAYRLPLQLCYLEGYSHTEAAKMLGWPVGTVATRIARGRERLRNRLTRRGVVIPAAGITAVLSAGSTPALPPILVVVTALSIRSGDFPNTVRDLTAGVLKAMSQPKKLISFIAAMAVVAIGAAITWGGMSDSQITLPATPLTASDEPAPVKSTPSLAPLDRHGDPLPSGAISRLGTVRQRAPGAQVAVTADGKQIVTVDKNLVIRRFDAATGALQSSGSLPATPAYQILISPTGKRLASIHWVLGGVKCKYTIIIWDLERTEVIRSLTIEGFPVKEGIAFSPDEQQVGLTLGSRAEEGEQVQIWDLVSEKVRTLHRSKQRIWEHFSDSAICFSPDGKCVAAWLQDRGLHCWDLKTEKLMWNPSDGYSSIFFFSPDSKWVVTENCQRLDATTGKPMPWPHPLPDRQKLMEPIGVSPDGRLLAIRTRESGVLFWDHASGKVVHEIAHPGRMPDDPLYCINNLPRDFAFTPDCTGYVWRAGPLQRWDLRTGKPVFPDNWSDGHSEAIDRVAFSLNSRQLASLATQDESRVRVWDVAASKTQHEFSTGMSSHLAFGPDGHVFALAPGVEKLALIEWDAEMGRTIRGYNLPDKHSFGRSNEAGEIHVDPKKTTVTVLSEGSGNDDSVLTTWDIRTGNLLRHEVVNWDSVSAFTTDGTGVVAIDRSWKVKLLATESGKLRIEFQFKSPWPGVANDFHMPVQIVPNGVDKRYLWKRNIAVSPDGRFTAVSIKLIDLQSRKVDTTDIFVGDMGTGQQLARLPIKGDVELSFSPDSRLLVSADRDGIHLWETATWKSAGTIAMPNGLKADARRPWATALAISPDLRQIATGHPDGTILLWDASLGQVRKPVMMEQPARLWDDLASDEATRAYAAEWQLAGTPSIAIRLIQERLKPIEPIAADELQRLVAKLGDNDFITREAAHRQLQSYGERATAAIREALKLEVTAEQRRRLESLLNTPRSVPLRSGETLRGVRAVAILDRIGSPESRRVLETLARGAADARLTREAKVALDRLASR